MDSFITTFHIDWKIILAQGINFSIVFSVLYFLALKPLKTLMKDRSEHIAKGLEDAKKNKDLLITSEKEHEEIVRTARAQANEIFTEAKKEAELKKTEMIGIAQKDVENMINNAKKILEIEKVKMVEEAKGEIVSLVVKATEKLLESHKDESYEKKVLSQINKI
jgi:F-type H+-transporting ATPase subunit b